MSTLSFKASTSTRIQTSVSETVVSEQVCTETKRNTFPGSPDLRTIVSNSGVRWLDFRKALTPKYRIVWRDIGLCYLALAAAFSLTAAACVLGNLTVVLLLAPGIALWSGFWLASLNNFMHEAAHHNLARVHSTNDLLANLFITTWFGIDIKDYRVVHWQHHLHLGQDGDTEISYRNRPTIGLLLQTVTGVYLLKVLLRYDRAKDDSRDSRGTKNKSGHARLALLRTAIVHLGILTTFAALGWYVAPGWYVAAAAWLITIVGVFPTFVTIRQTLEHRPTVANGLAKGTVAKEATNRVFGSGLLANTLGSAGFNRHMLHHWDPAVSYTRLAEMESFMLQTNVSGQIDSAQSTYLRTFRGLLSNRREKAAEICSQPCPVCKSSRTSFLANAKDVEYCTTDDVYRYFECAECNSLFLEDPPADRLNVIYPTNYYSYQQGEAKSGILERIKHHFDGRLFKKLLKQVPGRNLRVLDVGGGTGWLLSQVRRVSQRIAETHEIDIDETARPAAEAAGHVFHAMRVEEFESPQKFDLVLMLNLIEHVADPATVLRSMTQLLSPGGILLIKTPNTKTLDRYLFQKRNWGGFHCPRHFVLFNLESFRQLAAQCGLKVVQAKYTQGAPQWTSSIMALLMRWKLVKVTAERPMYQHPLNSVLMGLTAAIDFARLPFSRTTQMFLMLKRDDASSLELETEASLKKSA